MSIYWIEDCVAYGRILIAFNTAFMLGTGWYLVGRYGCGGFCRDYFGGIFGCEEKAVSLFLKFGGLFQ